MVFYRSFISLSFAVLATTVSLGAAQTALDIGAVTAVGSSVDGGEGSWNVTGSGSDIWGYSDSFHFLHFEKSNDLTVTVFSESFDQNHAWAKAGVQIRESLEPNSPHASLFITGQQLIAMQWRKILGSYSSNSNTGYIYTHRAWLRLTKEGNKVTSYYKLEGEAIYTKLREEIIDFAAGATSFYVGIAVTSHINGQLATLTGSSFNILDEIYRLPVSDVGATGRAVIVDSSTAGRLTIKAAGTIGGVSDTFGGITKKFSGDGNYTTHLDRLEERTIDSKGGLMVRASSTVDSPHVSLLVHPRSGGLTMFYRESTGGDTLSKTVGVWDRNMELMLKTSGNTVTCFYKHHSFPEWYELGSATIALGTDYYAGIVSSSAEYGQHATLITGDFYANGEHVDFSLE